MVLRIVFFFAGSWRLRDGEGLKDAQGGKNIDDGWDIRTYFPAVLFEQRSRTW